MTQTTSQEEGTGPIGRVVARSPAAPLAARALVAASLSFTALAGIGAVRPGADLADLLLAAADRSAYPLQSCDVVVAAQKIVSKSEGRFVRLSQVVPTRRAVELAAITGKDPRVVQCVLDESVEVMRAVPGVLIVRHRSGLVHANAGVDESNVESLDGEAQALLLPEDADASALRLRDCLAARTGLDLGVIVSDSGGRAWRKGVIGFALGCSGFDPLEDWVGEPDLYGRPLRHTEVAVADQLAAGASFLMGEAGQGTPVVVIRGARLRASDRGAAPLLRPLAQDLFR